MGRFASSLLSGLLEVDEVLQARRPGELVELVGKHDIAIGFDFTVAGLGLTHGRTMLEAGVRPVIGTSGVSPEQASELDHLARELGLGGIVVPNFSLGMACLQRAARTLAGSFAKAEILERHHDRKRDRPSASALHTRALLQAAGLDEVPIHSVRLPGLYAHHELIFGGPGETVTLAHDMSGPEAFGPGIKAALGHVLEADGVAFGLEAVLASE